MQRIVGHAGSWSRRFLGYPTIAPWARNGKTLRLPPCRVRSPRSSRLGDYSSGIQLLANDGKSCNVSVVVTSNLSASMQRFAQEFFDGGSDVWPLMSLAKSAPITWHK